MTTSSSSSNPWIWSEQHKDHYMYSVDRDGQPCCQWAKQKSANGSETQQPNYSTPYQAGYGASAGAASHVRTDSVSNHDANMAPAAPIDVRNMVRFKGTPERGWYETLDPSYRMRTKAEAHRFFVRGRVFSMLWAETASATMARNGTENTAITVGRFGQDVFSQIRRFVIMKVNRQRHFIYACAISTYGNQGTMKYGCNASEHSIVYLAGSQPIFLQGEWEKGLRKDPIEIVAADATETMEPASRLRFGKIHSIEWNVKVRDIGKVAGKHMSKLVKYFKEEDKCGFDDDEDPEDEGDMATAPASAPATIPIQANSMQVNYAQLHNSTYAPPSYQY